MKYVNITFYHFFTISGFMESHRKKIKNLCLELGFKGSVVIAPEGINLMLVGERPQIEEFKDFLRQFINEKNLVFKESFTDYLPFNRMIVKAKEQLVPVNDSRIAPGDFTSEHLPPEELKKWLDEDRDLILLDTRNDFEIDLGTFESAKRINIKHFREFESKVSEKASEWKDKTVVAFCTGGIRCEKATPLMVKHGYTKVYQLDGGILNYFEKIGGKHWKGDCFVFDQRVALNSELQETNVVECFACRHPVTKEEQSMDTYVVEVSCPHCYAPA